MASSESVDFCMITFGTFSGSLISNKRMRDHDCKLQRRVEGIQARPKQWLWSVSSTSLVTSATYIRSAPAAADSSRAAS